MNNEPLKYGCCYPADRLLRRIADLERWKTEALAVIAEWDTVSMRCEPELGFTHAQNVHKYIDKLEKANTFLLRRVELTECSWCGYHGTPDGLPPEETT